MDEATHSDDAIEHEEIEKGGIAGPIFLTIFTLVMIGGLVAGLVLRDHETIQKIFVAPEWWVANIGEYHPLIVHLPIGIVSLVVMMEVCSWLSFGRYRPVTLFGIFIAFLTGILACVTGFFDLTVGASYQAEAWEDPWFQHMLFGVIFVSILGLAFLAKIWGRRNRSRGPVYGILLLAAAGVMGYGAHIGGVKSSKKDPVKNTLEGLGILEGGADVTTGKIVKLPKDRLAFAEVIVPIMENRCFSCHSEKDENGKGGLWMDTYENLLVGGELQEDEPEEYPTLVPGDAKKSYMIQVLNLPIDDDMHMPPRKKQQMESHEIEILTWWVNAIPARKDEDDFDYEDKTLEEMGAPQNILEATSKLMTPEELAAMEAEEKAAQDKAEAAKAAKREALQEALDTLKQDEAFKTSLGYVSQDSTDLAFSAVSLREKMDDDRLTKLAPIAESMTELGLGSSSVTEAALIEQLKGMKNLRKLNLSQTQAGDAVLDVVAGLENLEYLNLYGSQVTDAGIVKLKTLGNLKKLYLWQSKATPAGGEALNKELPGLEIDFGVE